jgi:inositol-phosphate phosphatase / L-galactose 1-phosphate phosphatase / histidinol-phosphatase
MAGADFSDACIALLHRLADRSGEIALQHFRTSVAVDAKGDDTPVTIADRDAEAAMREIVRAAFPDHGIIGEEHGDEQTGAEWLWILDPIDGTRSFINGVPLFGTLVGLWQRTDDGSGKPVLGCVNHPALKERWVGGANHPTALNGSLVKSRACARIAEASMYYTADDLFTPEERRAFTAVTNAVKRSRAGGTDCYHYAMVASGWIDMAVESGLKLHDYAAIVPVLQGAGATVSDWNGRPLALESEITVNGQVLACGDAHLHAEVVKVLSAAS